MITFITGTDTGVGKTITTAALVVMARQRGGSPYVMKPVQTGMLSGEPGDLGEIRRLVGGVPGHEGARLRDPLAPQAAARREGITLPSLTEQIDALESRAAWYDSVFVEGAGGIRVALGDGFDLLDLATQVNDRGHDIEFIVVTRIGLGTLNHTLLTTEAIRGSGLPLRGLVIGAMPAELDLASQENLLDLPTTCGTTIILRLPEGLAQVDSNEFILRLPDLPT